MRYYERDFWPTDDNRNRLLIFLPEPHLIDLVEEVERSGIAALNREDESQGHHRFLAARELRHEKRLPRGYERNLKMIAHTYINDAGQETKAVSKSVPKR